MKRFRTEALAVSMTVGMMISGCVDIDVGDPVAGVTYGRTDEGGLTKGEKYGIARERVRQLGYNVDAYEVTDKRIDSVRWVIFEKGYAGGDSPSFLTVRVDRGGESEVYVTGQQIDKYRGGRQVEKDDAYYIAKSIAGSYGVSPAGYEIHDKEITDHTYWVLFEHKARSTSSDWRDHFAIRVAPDGGAVLFKSP